MSDLKKKFEAASQSVKKLDEDPGNEAKLQLYGNVSAPICTAWDSDAAPNGMIINS